MEVIIKEINTDLKAFDVFTIFKEKENLSFLDSCNDFGSMGRYSFIGINPYVILHGSNQVCFINDEKIKDSVFNQLQILNKKHDSKVHSEIPFISGCIGYFSYDLGMEMEEIKQTSQETLKIPQYVFLYYDNLIIFNHFTKETHITACGILKEHHISIEEIEEQINNGIKVNVKDIRQEYAAYKSNFTKENYIQTVDKVREYIKNGDIYITNLTQQLIVETKKSGYDIYKNLRNTNPAPFSVYMKLKDFEIISASPERFIKIENKQVETRPIKGTRPRGKTKEEDDYNKNELINSEKDKAELLMIVDLERNDLSKVCKPHSVKVTELFVLEEYRTVFHLVSTVIGELEDDKDAIDCMKACFPGGSITGTPKIRAMEIIDELERINRNLYTGCIGYFDSRGNADFNIVIRTIIKKQNNAYIGVGGGITWKSQAEEEYQETLDKAKALLRVL